MRMTKAHKGALLLAASLALVLMSVLTCSSSPSTPSPTDNTSNPVADFVTAVEAVYPSCVIIEVVYGPQGAPTDPTAQAGAGSGWIVNSNGLIVTNNHVVDGAVSITVTLSDGSKFGSTAVKTDPSQDMAVVKINAQNLPAAKVGDSSALKMGQPVAAVGNSLDLGLRVTGGLVSRLDVSITYQNNLTLNHVIETDAVLNPGNSGGVLINTSGEVVGITNASLEGPTTDVDGFDYAISINQAMPVINNLISQIP
jgi:serine protease Do